ncbi:MAG: ribonuclease HI family protein [Burkholderiaceae bacterium]|nr:ribonuclease HI family protein [Burkholderiaceae bacterium]
MAEPIDTQAYWQAWFDGAALPNPGKIGVGVLLVSPAGQRSETSRLMPCSGCNNEAELHALCAALDLGRELGARHLLLRGDSAVGLDYVRGSDTTEIERLQVLISRARDSLRHFEDVQLLWIPRHRNRDADRLSRQALGLAEKLRKPTGRRRRA